MDGNDGKDTDKLGHVCNNGPDFGGGMSGLDLHLKKELLTTFNTSIPVFLHRYID